MFGISSENVFAAKNKITPTSISEVDRQTNPQCYASKFKIHIAHPYWFSTFFLSLKMIPIIIQSDLNLIFLHMKWYKFFLIIWIWYESNLFTSLYIILHNLPSVSSTSSLRWLLTIKDLKWNRLHPLNNCPFFYFLFMRTFPIERDDSILNLHTL